MRLLLAEITKFIHLAVVFFILFGFLSSANPLLITHLILVPVVVLQWRFNDGTCFLTNLENFFRGGSSAKPKSEQQGQFTKNLLGLCFNPLPSDAKIKLGLYVLVWGAFTISLGRLLY